jgi:FixJ family two-component response regulator
MLSGKRDVPVVVEAIKSGALDYIVKPFDADVVVARVRSAFATWVLDHDRDEACRFPRRSDPGFPLRTDPALMMV